MAKLSFYEQVGIVIPGAVFVAVLLMIMPQGAAFISPKDVSKRFRCGFAAARDRHPCYHRCMDPHTAAQNSDALQGAVWLYIIGRWLWRRVRYGGRRSSRNGRERTARDGRGHQGCSGVARPERMITLP